MFVTTGTPGGGQEATVMNSLSTLTHHGIIYVPLGYGRTFAQLSNLSEVHGGTSRSFALCFWCVALYMCSWSPFRIALGRGCVCGPGRKPPAECARTRDRQAAGYRILGDRLQVQVLLPYNRRCKTFQQIKSSVSIAYFSKSGIVRIDAKLSLS